MFCHQCGKELKDGSNFCHFCGTKIKAGEGDKITIEKNNSEKIIDQSTYVVSSKNKKTGLFLIIGPVIGMIVILFIYVIVSFVGNTAGIDTESSVAMNIIKIILGFLGLICCIGIIVGIPLGIMFLNKRELTNNAMYDERSGNGDASIIPNKINGWNWGAAGLHWIWGISHGVWISLLSMIPLVNIVMFFILGIKGNEWAWRAQKWESEDKFIAVQKKWKPWGITLFILWILLLIMSMLMPES